MATRAETPLSHPETLETIVQDEIRTCRSILAATEAFAAGLDPVDFEALEEAVSTRARGMRRLGELEDQAEALRGTRLAPPERLAGDLVQLRELTRLIHEADARAREATASALGAMRRGLSTVHRGQQGLRGYRGAGDLRPRFADKRG